MNLLSQKLTKIIDAAYPNLQSISDMRASEKPYPEKWSMKEILGHLIDSAANNHQRIVRMQEGEPIRTFKYSQEHWVSVQAYQSESWPDLVELWYRNNLHLAHVITHINPDTLSNRCDVGQSEPLTLQSILESYLLHSEHHLEQLFSGGDPRKRKIWK